MKAITGTDIGEAVRLLKQGKVVALPTETVYGLAGNALDEHAVLTIYKVKNRPSFDPLIVHISSSAEANKYAKNIPAIAQKLMDAFWPGPLTFLLSRLIYVPPRNQMLK